MRTSASMVPIALALTACSSAQSLKDSPVSIVSFVAGRNYEIVFRDLKAHTMKCFEESWIGSSVSIDAHIYSVSKEGEIYVIKTGLLDTKNILELNVKALGEDQTEVTVRDLVRFEAEKRAENLKFAAHSGASPC